MAVGYNDTIIYHQDSEKGAINWFRQRILEQRWRRKDLWIQALTLEIFHLAAYLKM